MSLFPPNSILEEEIFTTSNLGPDCDIIGRLLYRFGDMFILSALEDGQYAFAVDNYLQMLDSLTAHFIADEHWCWFDDFYSPDYTVSHIWEAFIPYIRSGALAGEPLAELESGLRQIEQSEAYQNYGRNPSKHRIEEHLMPNWVKHNRKLLKAGKMARERVEMMGRLVELWEERKRVKQYL